MDYRCTRTKLSVMGFKHCNNAVLTSCDITMCVSNGKYIKSQMSTRDSGDGRVILYFKEYQHWIFRKHDRTYWRQIWLSWNKNEIRISNGRSTYNQRKLRQKARSHKLAPCSPQLRMNVPYVSLLKNVLIIRTKTTLPWTSNRQALSDMCPPCFVEKGMLLGVL